jgi:hypothetical protein
LYLSSSKSSQYHPNLAKSTVIWNNIKIVEYGLESSIQLLLQLWLLQPFLPIIMTWDTTKLINSCVTGLFNFITLENYPACYFEKALFKIFLTITLLSLGISQMKKKPGQSFVKTLPMFISIFGQTVGRIVALKSLVLMTTILGHYKYFLFFCVHVLLVFLIKIFFDVKSLSEKLNACCKGEGGGKRQMWHVITFIISGISSTIVMLYLSRDKKVEQGKRHHTFLSHSAFQILILLENLFLVIFPFIADSSSYPPEDCFPANSKYNAIWIVILAWLAGAVFQVIHYKYCSPLSGLNGPQASSWFPPSQISFLATLCWKREVQRIEVNEMCKLQCKENR